MQTLDELISKIAVIPSRFAEGASAISPQRKESSEEMNFQDGFPMAYSSDPDDSDSSDSSESIEGDKGRYVQRNDMNLFGEIASREPVFRESGGEHTYSLEVSKEFFGYPEGAVLSAYDNKYLAKVRSTESGNKKPFVDENGVVIPNVIDCPVIDEDDSEGADTRILWKSVGWIYGLDEGLFHINLDYTRAQILPKEGGVIAEDSLVYGIDVATITALGNYSVKALLPITYDTNISCPEGEGINWRITNKGRCGNVIGQYPIVWFKSKDDGSIGASIETIPYVQVTGGTGNYALAFFAKAGTSFSGEDHIFQGDEDILKHPDFNSSYTDPYINWVAIPFKATIGVSEEEGR